MRWPSWSLTVIPIIASLAVSAILFQLGIFFFFLPIIFIPFLDFLNPITIKPLPVQSVTCVLMEITAPDAAQNLHKLHIRFPSQPITWLLGKSLLV